MSERRVALILEDEPIIAFTLEDMLLDLGYDEVDVASTLADARRRVEDRSPDIAILDVNIHGERSYEFRYVGVPVIRRRRDAQTLCPTGDGRIVDRLDIDGVAL